MSNVLRSNGFLLDQGLSVQQRLPLDVHLALALFGVHYTFLAVGSNRLAIRHCVSPSAFEAISSITSLLRSGEQ